jgi:hypothetical protein
VHLEIAEHLVGLTTYCVTLGALSLPEEDQSASLLGIGHGILASAREFVDWGICVYLGEFKFSYGASEHGEVDGRAGSYLWK